jgi:opacity protein-like surface antigen
MARILILAVVATLLLGGVLAADLALENPELEPQTNATDDQQQQFVEATAPFVRAGAPVALFALVVGSMLAAVRAVGG